MDEAIFKDIAVGKAFNGFFTKKFTLQGNIFLSLIALYYAKNNVFVSTAMWVGTTNPLLGVSKITQKRLSFSIFLFVLVFLACFLESFTAELKKHF